MQNLLQIDQSDHKPSAGWDMDLPLMVFEASVSDIAAIETLDILHCYLQEDFFPETQINGCQPFAVPASRLPWIGQMFKMAISEKKGLSIKTRLLSPSRESTPITVSVVPNGQRIGTGGSCLCVVWKEQRSGKIDISREAVFAWLDFLPEPAVIVDREMMVVTANGPARDLLGLRNNTLDEGKAPNICHLLGIQLSGDAIGNNGFNPGATPYKHPGLVSIFKANQQFSVEVVISNLPEQEAENGMLVMLHDVTPLTLQLSHSQAFQQEYASLFDSSPEGILIVEPYSGAIINANPAAHSLLQGKASSLVGTVWKQLFAQADHPAVTGLQGISNGVNHTFEAIWTTTRGDLVPVEVNCGPALFANSLPVVLAHVRNISDRWKAQEMDALQHKRLRLLEQLSKSLHAQAPVAKVIRMAQTVLGGLYPTTVAVAVLRQDRQWEFAHEMDGGEQSGENLPETVYLNAGKIADAFTETLDSSGHWQDGMMVTSDAELIDKLLDLIEGVRSEQISQRFRACQSRSVASLVHVNSPNVLEAFILSISTSPVTELSVQPIMQLSGQVSAMLERYFSDLALKKSETRYRSLFEANLAGVYLMDLEGIIMDCNQAFASILGLSSPAQIIGRKRSEFICIDSNKGETTNLAMASKKEACWKTRNGNTIWVIENISNVTEDYGKLNYFECTVFDVSDLKRSEAIIEDLARIPYETPSPVLRFSKEMDLMYSNQSSKFFLEEFVGPDMKPKPQYVDLIEQYVDSRDPKPFELELGIRVYLISIIWVKDREYFNLFAHDITQQKRIERQKDVIFRIAKIASGKILSFESVCHQIQTELGKVIDTSNFYIALQDETTGEISFPYMVDENLPVKERFASRMKGRGITEYVLRSGNPAILNQAEIRRLISDGFIQRYMTIPHAWVGAPLVNNGRVIGLIAIQSYHTGLNFGPEDLDLLRFASDMIAQALQHAQDQEKLVKSETELRLLAENAPNSIIRITKRFMIEYVNKPVPELGFEVGKSIRGRISQANWPDFQHKVMEIWRSRANGTMEFNIVSTLGETKWFSANITPFPKMDGQESLLMILDDITLRKQSEIKVLNALTEGQERERMRIAQELHDGLGQLLSVIKLNLRAISAKNENKTLLLPVIKVAEDAIIEYKSISRNLIPPALQEKGLYQSLVELCGQIRDLTGQQIDFEMLGQDKRIPEPIAFQLFRIIQELVNNAVKYAQAELIEVFLHIGDGNMTAMVSDNGIGFDTTKIHASKGTGIRNIFARAKLMAGNVQVESSPGFGTSITIRSNY